MLHAAGGPLSIGPVEIPNAVFLAPMSGITDLPFRKIATKFGAGAVVSEMIASKAFTTGQEEMRLRAEGDGTRHHIVQLAGNHPDWMAEGARLAQGSGADIIDINMGCPAKRVTTGYSGSALMRDLDHAIRLIDATIAATCLPVTVKMRLGWDDNSRNAASLAKRAEESGISLITVHGRTRCQFYKGTADWSAIQNVKQAVSIPLVANGDLFAPEDALNMLEKSGADGVMVGRGAYGKPWLAGHTAHFLATGEIPVEPAGADLLSLVVAHYEAMLDHYPGIVGIRCARKHLGWYMDLVEMEDKMFGSKLRKRILTSGSSEDVISDLELYFLNPDKTEQAM